MSPVNNTSIRTAHANGYLWESRGKLHIEYGQLRNEFDISEWSYNPFQVCSMARRCIAVTLPMGVRYLDRESVRRFIMSPVDYNNRERYIRRMGRGTYADEVVRICFDQLKDGGFCCQEALANRFIRVLNCKLKAEQENRVASLFRREDSCKEMFDEVGFPEPTAERSIDEAELRAKLEEKYPPELSRRLCEKLLKLHELKRGSSRYNAAERDILFKAIISDIRSHLPRSEGEDEWSWARIASGAIRGARRGGDIAFGVADVVDGEYSRAIEKGLAWHSAEVGTRAAIINRRIRSLFNEVALRQESVRHLRAGTRACSITGQVMRAHISLKNFVVSPIARFLHDKVSCASPRCISSCFKSMISPYRNIAYGRIVSGYNYLVEQIPAGELPVAEEGSSEEEPSLQEALARELKHMLSTERVRNAVCESIFRELEPYFEVIDEQLAGRAFSWISSIGVSAVVGLMIDALAFQMYAQLPWIPDEMRNDGFLAWALPFSDTQSPPGAMLNTLYFLPYVVVPQALRWQENTQQYAAITRTILHIFGNALVKGYLNLNSRLAQGNTDAPARLATLHKRYVIDPIITQYCAANNRQEKARRLEELRSAFNNFPIEGDVPEEYQTVKDLCLRPTGIGHDEDRLQLSVSAKDEVRDAEESRQLFKGMLEQFLHSPLERMGIGNLREGTSNYLIPRLLFKVFSFESVRSIFMGEAAIQTNRIKEMRYILEAIDVLIEQDERITALYDEVTKTMRELGCSPEFIKNSIIRMLARPRGDAPSVPGASDEPENPAPIDDGLASRARQEQRMPRPIDDGSASGATQEARTTPRPIDDGLASRARQEQRVPRPIDDGSAPGAPQEVETPDPVAPSAMRTRASHLRNLALQNERRYFQDRASSIAALSTQEDISNALIQLQREHDRSKNLVAIAHFFFWELHNYPDEERWAERNIHTNPDALYQAITQALFLLKPELAQ